MENSIWLTISLNSLKVVTSPELSLQVPRISHIGAHLLKLFLISAGFLTLNQILQFLIGLRIF